MAFADFGDWDWTEHAADDGEQTDDSKKGLAVSAYPVLAFSFYHEYRHITMMLQQRPIKIWACAKPLSHEKNFRYL